MCFGKLDRIERGGDGQHQEGKEQQEEAGSVTLISTWARAASNVERLRDRLQGQ